MAEFLFAVPYKDLDRPPANPDTPQGHEELTAYGSYILAHEILPRHPSADAKVIEGTLEEDDEELLRNHEHWFSHAHGNETEHGTKHERVFLSDPHRAVRGMGGRVVHLLSCKCGVRLIPDLVSNCGAEAAVGYDDYFYVGCVNAENMPEPWVEEISPDKGDGRTAPICDLEIQKGLLGGRPLEDALRSSQERFKAEIDRYEDGDRSGWGEFSREMASCLLNNMNHQVMYTAERVPAPPPSLAPGLKLAAALGTIGVGVALFAKPAVEKMR